MYFKCEAKKGILTIPSKVSFAKKSSAKGGTSTETSKKKFSSSDVGKRVVVQGYDGIKGTIRFVGEHAEDGTARVGVEMDDSVGKNNGKVKVSEEDIHKKK